MSTERSSPENLSRRVSQLPPDQRRALADRLVRSAPPPPKRHQITFSIAFFSGDGTTDARDKYRLLLDAAVFADTHDFEAIWVPERHFVAFGGLFPNPAVLAAAIATRTQRVAIRAGSAVVPLHHPVRLVEEWAVVDNLSGGRVAISAASGWHADDFVLAPHAYAERRDTMFKNIELVRRLWRGEQAKFPGPKGEVTPKPLPRPLQPDLPIWITTAGTPETFERAGAIGANLLAGLLGLPLDLLDDGIKRYRAARANHGHDPTSGRVTAMVHAFLGENLAEAEATVREPMQRYLTTYLRQLDPMRGEGPLSDNDKQRLVDAAFERYFAGDSLLGTVDTGRGLADRLAAAGVDELACLIDFGVAHDEVMNALPHLNRLRQMYVPHEHGEGTR